MARAEPAVFGPVASDPTVSRLIGTLAVARPNALIVIRSARARTRERVWKPAGASSPDTWTSPMSVRSAGMLTPRDRDVSHRAWAAATAMEGRHSAARPG